MGEGGDFLVDEDTPKDTMLIKQESFYIQKKSNFTRPNKEKYFWMEKDKINNHSKSDHDLEVILNLKWGLERHCDVIF